MTVKPDGRFADVSRSSGCQCIWSVDAQSVVDVVPCDVTDSDRSRARGHLDPDAPKRVVRRESLPLEARPRSDGGGEAVVKATACGWGRWAGGAVDPGRAGAGLAVAEGLAAATPIGLEAAGWPVSPHGLARANAIPTTTRTTAIPTSLS